MKQERSRRIAMLSVHTSPLAAKEGKETGGMNVYVLQLSLQLAKKGIAIDIYTRLPEKGHKEIVSLHPNLRVIHLTAGASGPMAKKDLFAHLPEFTENFLAFTKRENISYDLIHSHYYLSGLVGIAINENSTNKTPLIHTFHTLGLMKNLVARESTEKETAERITAEYRLIEKADAIVAASEMDKEYLTYLYKCDNRKIAVINPGVDTSQFFPMEKAKAKAHIQADIDHKIILFVGRIEPLKGIDTLLYALKILLTKNPELSICLLIVGGDISQKKSLWSKELQKLEHVRQLLQLTTSVQFIGQRNPEDLPYYYNASELVIMPSHYESFGIAALEALACGTPVITTNVSGITDLLDSKHQDLVTSVNNPLELADKISFLLSNAEIYRQTSQEVVELVQDLDWKNVSEDLLALYSSFIE